MKKKWVLLVFLLIVVILLIWFLVFQVSTEKRPPTLLKTASGVETTEFQMHESMLFDAVSLSPRTGYTIRITREGGEIVTESRLSTDQQGRIPETVIWYDIGVRPHPEMLIDTTVITHQPEDRIHDFKYAGKNYTLSIMHSGKVVREMTFRVAREMIRPRLYAADTWGCPKSGFLIGEEDVWVIGENFLKGSIIRLWAVPASSEWQEGDKLEDKTTQYDKGPPTLFELKGDKTGFKKLLWPKGLASIGSYDIVAEVITYPSGSYHASSSAQVQNVVSHLSYSGFVVQRRQGVAEPLEMDIAGATHSQFTFRNTFLPTENVFVGVDPCIQPSYVGQTADIYIVIDKTDAQWTVDTSLTDTTGFVESITVGGICGNCWKTLAWSAPLIVGKYDVVLDFNHNGYYSPGVDLIDALDSIGFVVSEIRVDSISFNYSGSGAITIYDNGNGANVNAPEYIEVGNVIKPAAWVKGGSHSVVVSYKAVPGINNAQIWAEGGLGGLNSSGSPVTVTFSGGSGQDTFTVNSVPGSIGKHLFNWDWKYKNVNGTPSAALDMGKTGEHTVYTVYSTPNAPMATPWIGVIDRACTWAHGESDLTAARTAVTSGLNEIGDQDGDIDYWTANTYSTDVGIWQWQFNLTSFLNAMSTLTGMQFNCADCANALQVYENALGLGLQYRILNMGGTTNYIDPIGNGNPANSTDPVQNWLTIVWGWHCVGWLGGNIVYDACLHLDGDGVPDSLPCTRLLPANLSFATYRTALAPPSTPCNPGVQSVCTVH